MRSLPSLSLSGSNPTASTTASDLMPVFSRLQSQPLGAHNAELTLGPPQLQCSQYSRRILCAPARERQV